MRRLFWAKDQVMFSDTDKCSSKLHGECYSCNSSRNTAFVGLGGAQTKNKYVKPELAT